MRRDHYPTESHWNQKILTELLKMLAFGRTELVLDYLNLLKIIRQLKKATPEIHRDRGKNRTQEDIITGIKSISGITGTIQDINYGCKH